MSKRFLKAAPELVASAVAESQFVADDKIIIERYGISLRTLQRWRSKAKSCPELAPLVAEKRRLLQGDWAHEASVFLIAALRKLSMLVADADKPEHIHAVAGALKIVGELKITCDVLYIDEKDQQLEMARNRLEIDWGDGVEHE